MHDLGGMATLSQLNQAVFQIRGCEWKTKTPFASIRRIVQTTKGIYKIAPGLYGLESHRKVLESNGIIERSPKTQTSDALKVFSHSYYQGILLKFGNLRRYDTFVPCQDRNKYFLGIEKLGDIGTLRHLPPFSYPNLMKRSSSIDVIWFNHRHMPNSFFEIEHSTDIQNSLLKFEDLQDFYARMIIVADKKREHEFVQKMKYEAFRGMSIHQRINFLDYDSLVRQYEQEEQRQQMSVLL